MKLSQFQIDQFQEDGYIIVQDVLTEEDLAPVIKAICRLIDQHAKELKEEGKIQNLYENDPFEQRYAKLYAECKEIGRGMDIYEARAKEMFEFLHNPNLLEVVESIVGSEISCNPIQHLRGKVPAEPSMNVSWHQDAGVTLEEADPYDIFTFWIPLVDAVAETGCMDVMPGVHKQGYLEHVGGGIVPDQLPDVATVAAPCRKGGMVIMTKFTPHHGLPNVSDIVRWSIDLRYQKTGDPTGRPFYPDFVVRSKSNPDKVMNDYDQWCTTWEKALVDADGKEWYRS